MRLRSPCGAGIRGAIADLGLWLNVSWPRSSARIPGWECLLQLATFSTQILDPMPLSRYQASAGRPLPGVSHPAKRRLNFRPGASVTSRQQLPRIDCQWPNPGGALHKTEFPKSQGELRQAQLAAQKNISHFCGIPRLDLFLRRHVHHEKDQSQWRPPTSPPSSTPLAPTLSSCSLLSAMSAPRSEFTATPLHEFPIVAIWTLLTSRP